MEKIKNVAMLLGVALAVSGCASASSASSNKGGSESRSVGHVRWHKNESRNVRKLVENSVPKNSAGVFFYRQVDNDGLQTSANVAINDRFQVSLQPGRFSQVYSCSGQNELSVAPTGNKHNDLLRGAMAYTMAPGQNYFFEVDVSGSGAAMIKNVPEDVALAAMDTMTRQTHQISRVVPNCPQAPARIELKVLFDTDKSFVKKRYYPEIKRVADYMAKYPNTTAVIEGHTDSRASDQYNVALSQRRVDAVRAVLINHFGVAGSKLQAVGYGETRPVASNATTEGRQQNRRVIAVFSNN